MLLLLKIDEVAALLRRSVPTIRRWVKEARGKERSFPLPITDSYEKMLWRSEDIMSWIGESKYERSAEKQETLTANKERTQTERVGLLRHGITL